MGLKKKKEVTRKRNFTTIKPSDRNVSDDETVFISQEEVRNFLWGINQKTGKLCLSYQNSDKSASSWRDWMVAPEDILSKMDYGDYNYWSINSFGYNGRRTIQNIHSLNAIAFDIDCYKVGKTKQEVIDFANECYAKDILPKATMLQDSGSGIYFWLKIERIYTRDKQGNIIKSVMNLYKRVFKQFFELFKPYGADGNAKDITRVLKIPGSVDCNTGRVSTVIEFNKENVYKLKDLALKYTNYAEFLEKKEEWKAWESRLRAEGKWLEGEAYVEHEIKTKIKRSWIEKQSKLVEKKEKGSTPTKSESHNPNVYTVTLSNTGKKVYYQSVEKMYKRRIMDIEDLVIKIRKGNSTHRNPILFVYAYYQLWLNQDDEYTALNKVKALNRMFLEPWDDKTIEVIMKSAKKYVDRKKEDTKKGLLFSNAALIDFMNIQESEWMLLRWIVPKERAEFLRKERQKEIQRKRRRNEKGELIKEVEKKKLIAKVKRWFKNGKSVKEIQALTNLSKQTVYNYLGTQKTTKDRSIRA